MADTTAMLPTSFFQGKPLEEGARCEIEVVSAGDNEVTVRYVPHEAEENSQFNGMVDETVAAQDEAGAY